MDPEDARQELRNLYSGDVVLLRDEFEIIENKAVFFDHSQWFSGPATRIVAHPGVTALSVPAMSVVIVYIATVIHANITHLRTIQSEPQMYFEIQTSQGSFICGGCGDDKEGLRGRQDLNHLFTLLSTISGLTVESVELEQVPGEQFRRSIGAAWAGSQADNLRR